MKKQMLCFLCSLLCAGGLAAQTPGSTTSATPPKEGTTEVRQDTLYFQFKPKRKMFWSGYKKNALFIDSLSRSIRRFKPLIESGDLKLRVLGFTTSYNTEKQNRWTAKNRSNQVKSYFILKNGIKEDHFYTTNFTATWRGMTDVVAITYGALNEPAETPEQPLTNEPEIPADAQQATGQPDAATAVQDTATPAESPQQPSEAADTAAEPTEKPHPAEPPYDRWAIKTNIAYLAATVANLGVEYSFGDRYSIDVPIIYSPYTVARDYRLRFLAVQPEFRYWLTKPTSGHFFGAHLNIGAFNIAVNKRERYQSPDGFYGAGISYGYVLPFARHWAAEFTLGAGYIHTQYDTYYNIPNGARYEKGKPYNYWGLTKVGINLVYRFNL